MSPGPGFSPVAERSPPVTPVAQYGSDDDHRDSTGFRNNSDEPSHSPAASSYAPLARRDDGKYEVRPNDSFWTISQRLYGTGAYFKALAQHNHGKWNSEDRLKPGDLIVAPTVGHLEKSYPDLCPKPSRREALQSQGRTSTVGLRSSGRSGRTYTVVEGDTLFNIARYELGKASRWAEIYDLNRTVLGKDFNYLTPGTQLAMPEGDKSEKSDVIAQPPGTSLRR
jgi:nucleoid-associated protein YgaU